MFGLIWQAVATVALVALVACSPWPRDTCILHSRTYTATPRYKTVYVRYTALGIMTTFEYELMHIRS